MGNVQAGGMFAGTPDTQDHNAHRGNNDASGTADRIADVLGVQRAARNIARGRTAHGRTSVQSPRPTESACETPRKNSFAAVLGGSPEMDAKRRKVDLSGRGLAELPHTGGGAEDADVVEVLLSKNALRAVPHDLARRWPRLQRLALGSNAIAEVPPSIAELRETLVWLDLTHNRVASFPDELGELQALVSLGASDCRLAEFPRAFTRLSSLRKLGVFNNMIRSIPPEIGAMRSLAKIDLSGNQLETLPAEIGRLTALTWLNLSNNRIATLPEELGSLVALRELGLANNRLRTLPDLSRLHDLSLLTLFNNALETLPDWLCDLPSLAKLDVSGNRITALPARILAAPALDLLNARGNALTVLPAPVTRDPHAAPARLVHLDVRENALDALPLSVLGPALCELRVAGNPMGARDRRGMSHVSLLAMCGDDSSRLDASADSGQQSNRSAHYAQSSHRGQSSTPTLREAAFAAIMHHVVHEPRGQRALEAVATPHVRALAREVQAGQCGRWCGHCRQMYMHAPVAAVDVREATDCVDVPFVVPVCSVRCARAQAGYEHAGSYAASDAAFAPRLAHAASFAASVLGIERLSREAMLEE